MKNLSVWLLTAIIVLQAGMVHADTVIEEVPDTLPGKGLGGLSGFMAGIVAGGPVGAILGTGIGWLAGSTVQDATGAAGKAYRVKRKDGSEAVVRSPNRAFSPGDRVTIAGNRLVALDGSESPRPVTLSEK